MDGIEKRRILAEIKSAIREKGNSLGIKETLLIVAKCLKANDEDAAKDIIAKTFAKG